MWAAVHGSSDDTWTESGLTWSNQPAFGAEESSIELPVGVTYVWYEWDVTSFIQGQHAGDKCASLVVKAATEGSATFDGTFIDNVEIVVTN